MPIFIVITLAVGAGAFYGGMKYQESTRQNFIRQNLGGQQMGTNVPVARNRTGGANAINGEIIVKDDPAKDGAGKSITVKIADGGSKIVFYSDSTEVGKFTDGTASDLEIGKTITVNGTANSDGSITSQSIQIRPEK